MDVLKSRQGQGGSVRTSSLRERAHSERERFGCDASQPQEEESEDVVHVNHEDNRPVVLVTNDDGVDAAGLRALVEALVDGGRCNVYVCAPDSEKSGVGHSITLRETLAVSSVEIEGATAYEVSGTPADCVSLFLSGSLSSWKKPSLVLSGINEGSNCGYHIVYSGTVAGSREACIGGVPSFAMSLDWKKGVSEVRDFKVAAAVCLPLIHSALSDIEKGIFPNGFFFNIGVPSNPSQHKGFRVTRQGTSRSAVKWSVASSQRDGHGPGLWKKHAVGARLAQLGLAASAVGAARRINSMTKNTEIESVAGPENGPQTSISRKKQYYLNEVSEVEVATMDIHDDLGALRAGYVTVTPMGLLTYLEPEFSSNAADWIASSIELAAPFAL